MRLSAIYLVSRNRRNLTERFPELREVAEHIKLHTAILDGKIDAPDKSGRPSFDALRYRQRRGAIARLGF